MYILYFVVYYLIYCNIFLSIYSINAVAFECGKPAIFLNDETWVIDDIQHCLEDDVSVVNYCKIIYHNENISKAVSAPSITISLTNWCRFDDKYCDRRTITSHNIKPYICLDNIPPSLISIHEGCQLSTQLGTCENVKYWQQLSDDFCSSQKKRLSNIIPSNPCIKEGIYTHLHFSGIQMLCCDMEQIRYQESHSWISESEKPHLTTNDFSSHPNINYDNMVMKLENYDKIFENYLSHPSEHDRNGIPIPEHVRYGDAKLAFNSATLKREENLEKQLSDAETVISINDWQTDPIHSQISEDSLLKEFRDKFVNLENESEQKRKTLELVHQQRLESQMFERRKTVLNAWQNVVESLNPNNDTLFKTLERLLQIVEHDRLHFIRRYERLRMSDPIEAATQLPIIKTNLIELDLLLNASLEKLDIHPQYKYDLLNYVHNIQTDKYKSIESAVKSILVANVDINDLSPLPTNKEQATMKAERILAKYRHHLDSQTIENVIPVRSETNDGDNIIHIIQPRPYKLRPHSGIHLRKVNEQKRLHEPITTTIPTTSTTTTTIPQWKTVTITNTKINNKNKLIPNHINQTTIIPLSELLQVEPPKIRSNNKSILSNEVMNNAPTEIQSPNKQTIPNNKDNKLNKTTLLIFSVIVILSLGVIMFYLTRWYITRVRPNQKGYTLTVVEVDEVSTSKDNSVEPSPPFGPVRSNRRQRFTDEDDDDDSIRNWQMNGYENPAYKLGNENNYMKRKILI